MNSRILLTGRTGQVGSELLRLLPQFGEVIAPDRRGLDLLDLDNLRRAVRDVRPQLIVNAAAYTAVDAAENDQAAAYAINANVPAVLAEEAKKIGAAIVHYSTDYVFDGSKATPYEEADVPNPINVYGKSKLKGEQAIRTSGVPHLIFRTSWVYATQGRNFLLTILRLATEREELRIVRDQTGSPTWAREIAASTGKVLAEVAGQGGVASGFSQIDGTYHMTAARETTWHQFASLILEQAARVSPEVSWFAEATRGLPLITKGIIPITTAEYPTPAARPAYSVLSNSLFIRTFGFELPDWRVQLQRAFSVGNELNRSTSADDLPITNLYAPH